MNSDFGSAWRRTGVGVLFAIASLVLAHTAIAQAEPSVLLVRVPGDGRISARLRAELLALGYQIIEVHGQRLPRPLASLGTRRGVIAALRSTPSRTGVELWIGATARGAATEELVTSNAGGRHELLAIRAVETLRARLIELGVREAPPPDVAPVLDLGAENELPPSPGAEDHPPPFGLALGLGVTDSPGGIGGSVLAVAALGWQPLSRWAFQGFGTTQLSSTKLGDERGDADVSLWFAGVVVERFLVTGPARLALGAGMSVVVLRAAGETAAPPLEVRAQSVVTPAPLLRISLRTSLSRAVGLRADLNGAIATPGVVVSFADDEIARWGRPFTWATLALDVGLGSRAP